MMRTSPGMLVVIMTMMILAGATYWLLQTSEQDSNLFHDKSVTHTPDYIAQQLSVTQLNPDGTPKYQFNAKTLTHYEDDQSSYIDYPSIRFFQKAAAPVTVTADEGLTNKEASIIHLRNHAQVSRPAFEKEPNLLAQSTYFKIDAKQDMIETDQPVVLKRGLSIVKADGMKYDNVTRYVQLFGNVHGSLDPAQ